MRPLYSKEYKRGKTGSTVPTPVSIQSPTTTSPCRYLDLVEHPELFDDLYNFTNLEELRLTDEQFMFRY